MTKQLYALCYHIAHVSETAQTGYASYDCDLSFRGVKNHGLTKAKNSDRVCEECGVSLEQLPRSFLKTRKGTVFETSPDVLEVV